MFTLSKLIENQFSEWLRANGIWLAVGLACLLFLILLILFILNKKKEH